MEYCIAQDKVGVFYLTLAAASSFSGNRELLTRSPKSVSLSASTQSLSFTLPPETQTHQVSFNDLLLCRGPRIQM